MERVLCFLHTIFLKYFLGEYTYIFLMHMMYDTLVTGMIVYDMQVWCSCVLSEVPPKFMASQMVIAMACMDMDHS